MFYFRGKGNTSGQIRGSLLDNGKMESSTEMGKLYMLMALFKKEFGKWALLKTQYDLILFTRFYYLINFIIEFIYY